MNTLERLKLTNLLKKTVDERNAESNTLKRLKLANQVQELRKQLGLIVVEPLTPQQNIENGNTMQAHFNKKIADALIHKNHKVLDVSQVSKVYKIPKHIKNIAFYKNLYGLNELSNLFFAIVENEQGEIYANAYIADTAIDLSRLKHDGVFPDIGVTQLMTEEVEALRSLHNDLDAYFTSYENLNRANKKIIKGRTNSVKTAKGTKIDTVFALVDSKYVIASHTENGNENPKYDQSLQPRDRSRESSIAWVSKTANNLDPESLGRTGRADTGAPIIGDDMMVESGNGRTMAIKLAYKNGKAEEYRQWLIDEADMFGFTEAQVSQFKEPILVRIRTSEIDRATFANYTYKMLHLDCIFKA